MKESITLLSVFCSSGYSKGTGRYIYSNYHTPRTANGQSLTNPLFIDNSTIAPVRGFPIPAKHTLLAQLLKSNTPIPSRCTYSFNVPEYVQGLRAGKHARPKPASAIEKAKKSMPLGSLLGVEIEHYPTRWSDLPSGSLGNYTHDGSLGTGGIELRRLTWVGQNGRINGILSLKPLLEGAHITQKCGLHVHVDIRHLPTIENQNATQHTVGETYDRLCSLYPIIKKLVPKSRLTSTYCRWANNRSGSDSFRYNSQGNRYSALNYDSVSEHGTIEWRMQGGSTNVVKIESWALLCQFLTRWASVKGNSMPRNWDQFLAILPQWLASWCVLRRERLYGDLGPVDERVSSAVSQTE